MTHAGYVVEVWNGKTWRKRRGPEGGPWRTLDRAQRMAEACAAAPRRSSSSDGRPHRVREVAAK